MPEPAGFKIGPWTVAPGRNLIEREDRSVRLEPRAMDLLVCLAGGKGAVVSQDELIESVWQGTVVSDGAVYFAVNQLRRALGDEGRDGTSYIETIRKRGYRLVAPVELLPTTSPVENRQDVRAHSRLITSTLIGVAAVVAVGLGAALWHRAEPTLPGPIALAVLPFADLSPRGDRAHLADGVTEAIRTSLARVEGLQMTGRTSAEYFRNRNEELSTIAAVLGVDYVLEGSLGLEGDSVSITARLIDTASGFSPWSEPYRQTLDNVFVLQDEIAESVAAALEITLGVGELGRIPGMTRDVAAWNEFLTAVGTIELTPLAIQSAIDHLERAVDIDPEFAVGWADLAGAYEMAAYLMPGQIRDATAKSALALERARRLAPDSPHLLLHLADRSTSLFEKERLLEAALAQTGVNAVASDAAIFYAAFLASTGRMREAITRLERARSVDPLNLAIAQGLTAGYAASGDIDRALAEGERGIALEGPQVNLRGIALFTALASRDRDAIERWFDLMPADTQFADLTASMERLLDEPSAALIELKNRAVDPAYQAAFAQILISHWAAYFQDLDLALETFVDDPAYAWRPIFRELRSQPEFKPLLRQAGLVEYWRTTGEWGDFCRPVGQNDFACD